MSLSSSICRTLARSPASSMRCFSSVEALKEGLEKVERHRKVHQNTSAPASFSQVLPSGKDLYVAANMSEIAALTGMPEEHQRRTVVIAPRMLKTMQSGDSQSYQWHITWKHSNRWSNSLMGWSSSADPMSGMRLNFDSKEEAIAYASKNGWKYEERAPHAKANENEEAGAKIYAHNFLAKRTEAELADARAKGVRSKEYNHAGAGKSNWFMQLTYHGDADVVQYGDRAPPAQR